MPETISRLELMDAFFDKSYYSAQIDETLEVGDLREHYLRDGWRVGLNPSEMFHTEKYLEAYPDVREIEICPLLHYIVDGLSEGRQCFHVNEKNPYEKRSQKHKEYEVLEGELDTEYYLNTYPDIKENRVDPISHYIDFGWREGRNPAEWFSTQEYLDHYEDVRIEGINPFFHYISVGRAENRQVFSADVYARWIAKNDYNESYDKSRYIAEMRKLHERIKFSIIIPTYNTEVSLLKETIESVFRQIYKEWELCICDDGSKSLELLLYLDELTKKHENVSLTKHKKNKHISAASNSALASAKGEWVVMLDHDDLLAPHALAELAISIDANPGCSIIYSDEDKIDDNGRRYDPFFKPDWSYTQFLGQNYLNHLSAFRRGLVDSVGGWRVGFEGSQDYDLLLRMIEKIPEREIIHIPKILYHWRATADSTASNHATKGYASVAASKALEEHLNRTGQNAVVQELDVPGVYRPVWKCEETEMLVSVIIPTRNRVELLEATYKSLRSETSYKNIEILIADNDSDDPTTKKFLRKIARHKNTKIIKCTGDFNFSAINNLAAKHASGDSLLLLNNDITVINSDWLTEMVAHLNRDNVGCVGAKLYYPNDTLQHGGIVLGIGGVAGHSHKNMPRGLPGHFSRMKIVHEVSAVTGACLLVYKHLYFELGGLDEALFKVAFNDVDFCLRVRQAGYKIVFTPFAELYHHESASRGHENTPEKAERFQREVLAMKRRWGELLMKDPHYSPNLTLDREDFSLR